MKSVLPTAFEFSNYKSFIKARVDATPENRGLIGKLAEACGCQRSYFSKMLNEHVHLLPEHAYGLCQYWNLPPAEENYFLLLLELERSGSSGHQAALKRKLKSLRDEQANLKKRLGRDGIEETAEGKLAYYSSWHYGAIHILISIPKYRRIPEIAARLELSVDTVSAALERLRSFGFVEKHGDEWKISKADLHLSKDSPLIGMKHNNWRQRAVLDAQRPNSEGVHYSVTQSMSKASFEKLKQQMLLWIDQFGAEAGPSKEEELYNFNLDFYQV